VINLTPEDKTKLVIMRPQGAQGGGFGIQIESATQFAKFDEAVGELPEKDRKKTVQLKEVAHKVGIAIVDN